MTLLAASIGWGLLTIGAVTHSWHHKQLRELLAMHIDRERVPAALLTAAEAFLAISIPVAYFTNSPTLPWLAVSGALVATGFVAWIGRLLATASQLPCACSFSQAPTTLWSLARAAVVLLVGLFIWTETATDFSQDFATLLVGLAVSASIYVVPEAVSWPEPSRAVMARVEAFETAERMNPTGLIVVVGVAVGILALVLNHVSARLAIVELTLNEGLPPGHRPTVDNVHRVDRGDPSLLLSTAPLDAGLHVFLSRNCFACQRLIAELEVAPLGAAGPVHLRYIDRPRPVARLVAESIGAELHQDQGEHAQSAGADPLPFAVAIGPHGLRSGSVAPTITAVQQVARNAGMSIAASQGDST